MATICARKEFAGRERASSLGGIEEGIEVADWLKGSTITTRSLYSFSLFKWLNYCRERAAKLDCVSAQKTVSSD